MHSGKYGQIPFPKMLLRSFPTAVGSSHLTRDQKLDARVLYLEITRDSIKADILVQAIDAESRLAIRTNGVPTHHSTSPVPEPDDLFLDSLERRFDPSRHKKPVFKPAHAYQPPPTGPTADSITFVLPLALETNQKSREYDTQAAKTIAKYYASKRRDAKTDAGLDQLRKSNGPATATLGGYERDRDPRLAGRT